MVNKVYKYFIILSFIFISLTFIKIDNKNSDKILNTISKTSILKEEKISQLYEPIKEEDNKIGKIIIEKININRPLYNINDSKNNIEENITILKESIMPDKENSIVFIAAHSGTGPIAFFKNLNRLEEEDEVILEYDNKTYRYIVKNIWETEKNGYISVNKEKNNQLILTTCSPNKDKYQLIINCIQKESNQ